MVQVLLMRLFPSTHVLRSVPAPRRLLLYNAWRAKWGEQYSQLQELLAAERGVGVTMGSLVNAAKVMASKLQVTEGVVRGSGMTPNHCTNVLMV